MKKVIDFTSGYSSQLFFIKSIADITSGDIKKQSKVLILISEKIDGEIADAVEKAVSAAGSVPFVFRLQDGEKCKTIDNALKISAFLSDNGFTVNDVIINIGGGTVCDLGGFVASVYKRGIKYFNLPTTLLCAVDACFGGKTAIDCGGIKNLWGTFYQPAKVFIVSDIIENLPESLIKAGMSEIVKYAVIDGEFFDYLTALPIDLFNAKLSEITQKCLEIKAKIVVQDEKDKDIRHALNCGHTVAHAVEIKSGYNVSHADAVSLGLISETEIAYKVGLISEQRYHALNVLYGKYFGDHATLSGKDLSELIPHMSNDKKNQSNKICFVLPCENSVKAVYYTEKEILKVIGYGYSYNQ